MGSDKENEESKYKASIIYTDIEDFDLGKDLEKLKEENKILLNHIRFLEGDVEKLAAALLKLKSLQENLTKNISSLYMTAKTEIERKDRIIADLRTQLDDITFRRIGITNHKRKADEVMEANSKKAKYQDSEDSADQQSSQKLNKDVIEIEEDAGSSGSSKKLVEKNVLTSNERSRNRNTREVYEPRSRHEEFFNHQDHDRSYREYKNRSKSRDRRKQYDDDHVYYSRDEEFHNRGIGHRYNNSENNRNHRTDYGENRRRNYRSEQNMRCRQNRNTDEDEFYNTRREIHSEMVAANTQQNEVSGRIEHSKTSIVHDPSPDRRKHDDKEATKSVRKKLRVIHKLERERDRKQPNPRSTISSENTPSSSSKKVNRSSIEKIASIFSDGIHDIMDTVLQEVHEILPREVKTQSRCHEAESSKPGKRSAEKNIKSIEFQANTKGTKEVTETAPDIPVDSRSNSKNFDYSSGESGTVKDNIMRQSDMESLLKQSLIVSHSEIKNKHTLRDEKGPLDAKEIEPRDILASKEFTKAEKSVERDDKSLGFDSKTKCIDVTKANIGERNKEKVDPKQCNIKQEQTSKENTDKIENNRPGEKSSTKNNTPRMDPSYKIPKKERKSLREDDFPDKYNTSGKYSAHETSKRREEKNDRRPGRERSRDDRSSNRSKSEGRLRSKSEGRRRSRSRPNYERRDDKYRGRSSVRNKTSRSRSRSIDAQDRRKYHWSRRETVASARGETRRSISEIDKAPSRCRSLTPVSSGDWVSNDHHNNANKGGGLESPDEHKERYRKDEKVSKSGLTIPTSECEVEENKINITAKRTAAKDSETSETGGSNIKKEEVQIQKHLKKTRLSVGDRNMETNIPIAPSQNRIVQTHLSSNQQEANRVEVSSSHRPPGETASVVAPEVQNNKPLMKWKIQKIEEFVQLNTAACSSSNQHGNHQLNQQQISTNISSEIPEDRTNCGSLKINEQNLLNKEPRLASESNARVVDNCRQLTLREMGITARLGEQNLLRQMDAADIKLKDIPETVNQHDVSQVTIEKVHEKQKSIQSKELTEGKCPPELGESKSIAKEENKRKLETFLGETSCGNNQDTMIARNVELKGPSLNTKVTKIIDETSSTKQKSRDEKIEKIDRTTVEEERKRDESEVLATQACKKISPVDSNSMISEKLNTGTDTKTQIDNVDMKNKSLPLLTELIQPEEMTKLSSGRIITLPKALDNYKKKKQYVPCLEAANNRRRKLKNSTADSSELISSKDSESETQIQNKDSEGQNLQSKGESLQNNDIKTLVDKPKENKTYVEAGTSEQDSTENLARLIAVSQPQNEEKCGQNIQSRNLSLPVLSQSPSPEKLTKPTNTSISPIPTPKKQIKREQSNKTKSIAGEERKRKLETVINNISKRKSSEAVDTTDDEKINTGDPLESGVVNLLTQPISEARRTVKKENISKVIIEETPIRKLDENSDLKKNITKATDESDKTPSEASEASTTIDNKKVRKNIKETPIRKLDETSALKKNTAKAGDESAENASEACEASATVENKRVSKNIRKLDENHLVKKTIAKAVDESAKIPSEASEASGIVENKKVSWNIKETSIGKLNENYALKKITAKVVDESAKNPSEASEAHVTVSKNIEETPIRKLEESSVLKKSIAKAGDESAKNPSEANEASGTSDNIQVSRDIKETSTRKLDKNSSLKKTIAKAVDEAAENPSEASEARVTVSKNIKETPIRNLDKSSVLKKNIAKAGDELAENPSEANEASGTSNNIQVSRNIKEASIRKLDKNSSLKKTIAKAVNKSAKNLSEASEASDTVETKRVSWNIKETPIRKLDKNSASKKTIAKAVDESTENPSKASEASATVHNKKVSKNIKETSIRQLDETFALKKNVAKAGVESAKNLCGTSEASGTVENRQVSRNIKETSIRKLDKNSALMKTIAKAVDESAKNPSEASESSGTVEIKKVFKEPPIGNLDLEKNIAKSSKVIGKLENKKVPKDIAENSTADTASQTPSKQLTPNKSHEPTRKRITPIPVKDPPICSFENILVKNQSPFSRDPAIQVSPLSLTHEGEIPVLHLEENHFCNLRAEGQRPVDSNIMSLLDQMNISNMDCDITKFGPDNEKAATSGTPANFENAVQTAPAAEESEVRTEAPPGGQNTPFVRRRRRCRLVVLK